MEKKFRIIMIIEIAQLIKVIPTNYGDTWQFFYHELLKYYVINLLLVCCNF